MTRIVVPMLLENFTYILNKWSRIYGHCPFDKTKKMFYIQTYTIPQHLLTSKKKEEKRRVKQETEKG